MIGPTCHYRPTIQNFVEKVVDKLTDTQLDKYGITSDTRRAEAIEALTTFLMYDLNGEVDSTKRSRMLSNIDDYVEVLEALFIQKVPKRNLKEAQDQYNHVLGLLNAQEQEFGTVGTIVFTPKEKEDLIKTEILFINSGVVKYYKTTDPDSGETILTYILASPVESEEKTPQQKTLDRLNTLALESPEFPEAVEIDTENGKKWVKGYDLQVEMVKMEGDNYETKLVANRKNDISKAENEGWHQTSKLFYKDSKKEVTKTGRSHYKYKNSRITARSVTFDPANADAAFPVLASHAGNVVDAVGRWSFDKSEDNPILNSDESIKEDKELQHFIDIHLNGMLTVEGLKNLIQDFKVLENQLKKMFNDDNLKFFTGNISLFGKQIGSDIWTVGKPDLLAVDSKGIVHVVDFKTVRMRFGDDYDDLGNRAEKYGAQESNYIRILQSLGLAVDQNAYIVQVDTWYADYDKGYAKNRDEKGNIIEGREDIYIVTKDFIGLEVEDDEGDTEKITLGEYVRRNQDATRNQVFNNEDPTKEILYVEPRLHLKYDTKDGLSNEIAALRGEESGVKMLGSEELSFEQQWGMLSDEEKSELAWYKAVPVVVKTAQEAIKLDSDDIESRPDLISSTEIQTVAELLMYAVSNKITYLQEGNGTSAFPISKPEEGESPLKGKKRSEILKLLGHGRPEEGLKLLIEDAFKIIESSYIPNLPSEEDYLNENYDTDELYIEDYDDYLRTKRQSEKAEWLLDPKRKEQLITIGASKLIALEKCIVPRKNKTVEGVPTTTRLSDIEISDEDFGDNDSAQELADLHIEGLSDKESWMMGILHISPKLSLAQEIRRVYERIYQRDSSGKTITDPYGWGFPMHINATQAIQATLLACKDCETIEEMENAVRNLSKHHSWANEILEIIEDESPENENLRAKFFRHFRKDALNYSICSVDFDPKTGARKIMTRIVNLSSAEETMRQALGAEFYSGKVGTYKINGDDYSLVEGNRLTEYKGKTVKDEMMREIESVYKYLSKLYRSYNPTIHGRSKKEKLAYISKQLEEQRFGEDNLTITQHLEKLLNGIGIRVNEKVVTEFCEKKLQGMNDSGSGSNAYALLGHIKDNLLALGTMNNSKEGIPNGLKGNSSFRSSAKIIALLSSTVQDVVEASVYQDGKTYYSYTNPSRVGTIIRNLKNALGDDTKFQEYIDTQFGRYSGWFKTTDGKEWLCDWVKQFANPNDDTARTALSHKVELSYIGNQYKELGSLGFQLSILHNYFGSEEDQTTDKTWRWFALPTMSNKPTNEFVRMRKYSGPKEIIDKVLMPTFHQEMNRIADVLWHYAEGKMPVDNIDLKEKKVREVIREKILKQTPSINEKELEAKINNEVKALKSRISNHSVTLQDLLDLQPLTSGAKFHFLWYLNKEMHNTSFGNDVVEFVNILLMPGGKEKEEALSLGRISEIRAAARQVISDNMDVIVEDELAEMKKIGLFDTDTKKTESGETIEYLKYQDEFGGLLGNSSDEDAEATMKRELRDFIWQDIAANINIIQITGGDLAYYGSAVNYQKRIAQIHSPGLKMMHNPKYDDGYLRSVHVSDEKMRQEIRENVRGALELYMENSTMSTDEKKEYRMMIDIVVKMIDDAISTDGQSFDSPSSIRKKLRLQGEWGTEREEAYNKIIKGEFDIENLGVMIQPQKPFVTSDMAKYSDSPTMTLRRVPLQDKNSEYLILLAQALAEGSGQRSKLVAICKFMEDTHKDGDGRHGIDTVHFGSVNKVGISGQINIEAFDKEFENRLKKGEVTEDQYNDQLREYLHWHVRRADANRNGEPLQSLQDEQEMREQDALTGGIKPKMKREELLYNSQYVDTIPLSDYIIQQEVPAKFLDEHGHLYGSQIRILGISDITPSTPGNPTEFDVRGEKITAEDLIDEYKKLHAANIYESFYRLKKEFGIDNFESIQEKYGFKILSREEWREKYDIPYDTPDQKRLADENYDSYRIRNSIECIADLPIGTPERNKMFEKMEALLQAELKKDAKHTSDAIRQCTLNKNNNWDVIDFNVPLLDPTQSKRIQMLINSIIKKRINKQHISGGPVVQVTAYDRNLHIRFKGANGQRLLTFDEYGKSASEYRAYLKKNKASIEHFECYAPIPNAELERLLTNPDGTLMTFEQAKEKFSKNEKMKAVWDSMMEMIGYRIPTEDKYSMVPLKIVGFVPRAAGQIIMMPQEITFLTGSDFDIDKMYIMTRAFQIDENTGIDDNEDYWMDVARQYFKETGTRWNNDWETPIKEIIKMGNDIINGRRDFWSLSAITKTNRAKESDLSKFMLWYRDTLLERFSEYTLPKKAEEESESEYSEKLDSYNAETRKKMRDNRILDLQWAVLTGHDTLAKILNPGNFIEQKKTGRIIRVLKSKVENPKTNKPWTYQELKELDTGALDDLLENSNPHNTTLPSSKIYFQRQNMQGTQMVGIFANHNVSHAFCSFQKIALDLTKKGHDNTFMFCGHLIGDPSQREERLTILDRQKGFNGRLISKTIASFLAASVDTAKDPVLSDMNINTFTGGVAMVLARLGFDTASIGLFLSQPVIVELSELYFKKSTDGLYSGDTAIRELAKDMKMDMTDLMDAESIRGIQDEELDIDNFVEHLNDEGYHEEDDNFQKKVLKGFYQLYKIANDIQELTFCTKFNSVNNAVGPTIADTMEDLERVRNFIDNIEDSVFYVPAEDNDPNGCTDPRMVITEDPILEAFFNTTVSSTGASEQIFKNFFPHYFKGFQNVKQYFQDTFNRGKKLPSKLLNQLLDDYLYYIMTFQDTTNGYAPTIPTKTNSEHSMDALVKQLVHDYEDIQEMRKSVKEKLEKEEPDKKLSPNIILDQTLGSGCLRIRKADQFLTQDILVFNGAQLDAEGQQKVMNAWSDLCTMNDPVLTEDQNMMIKRFGVNLFFYTLMRNGFGFSPRTLMHLASVVVKFNATWDSGFNNYIVALRHLKELDSFMCGGLGDSQKQIERFCSQFVRNHSKNKSLVPLVNQFDKGILSWDIEDGERVGVEFGAEKNSETDLYYMDLDKNIPKQFVMIIFKDKKGRYEQVLYELEKKGDGQYTEEKDGYTVISYKRTNRLGVSNNFIEYDANSDLAESYFENIRNESEDSEYSEDTPRGQDKDKSDKALGYGDNDDVDNWVFIEPRLKASDTIYSEENDKEGKLRSKLRAAINASDNKKLKTMVDSLIRIKKSDKQGLSDKIKEICKEAGMC